VKAIHRVVPALFVAAMGAGFASAQDRSSVQEIERYRAALGDGNPAELWEARGEAMWKQKAGPKNASLEQCDIGLGPGVVRGAYAVMPKYFADTGKVQDLESRLVTCMGALQGIPEAEAKKDHFGSGSAKRSKMEALVAYITSESRGMKMNVSLRHPKEREAYEIGEKMFFYRAGPHDFACATCHATNGQRIRLQELPNLTDKAQASAPMDHGPHTASRRGRCAPCSIASSTATGSSASRSPDTRPTRSPPSRCIWPRARTAARTTHRRSSARQGRRPR